MLIEVKTTTTKRNRKNLKAKMLKLNIRILLSVLVSLFVLYSLVSVVSAQQARSLRLRPSSRSLRSTLEILADPSKRQQQQCENYICIFGTEVFACPDGCHRKLFVIFSNKN